MTASDRWGGLVDLAAAIGLPVEAIGGSVRALLDRFGVRVRTMPDGEQLWDLDATRSLAGDRRRALLLTTSIRRPSRWSAEGPLPSQPAAAGGPFHNQTNAARPRQSTDRVGGRI